MLFFAMGMALGILLSIALALKKDFFSKKSLYEALIPALILSTIVAYGLMGEDTKTFMIWITNLFGVLTFMSVLAYTVSFNAKMRLGITRLQFMVSITILTAYIYTKNNIWTFEVVRSFSFLIIVLLLVFFLVISLYFRPNNEGRRMLWALFNLTLFTLLLFYAIFPYVFGYDIGTDLSPRIFFDGLFSSFLLFIPIQAFWLITSAVGNKHEWERKLSKNILTLLKEDYYGPKISNTIVILLLITSLITFFTGLSLGINVFSLSMGIITFTRFSEELIVNSMH